MSNLVRMSMALALALVFMGIGAGTNPASAQPGGAPYQPGSFSVPPGQEIVVLDPRVSATGAPVSIPTDASPQTGLATLETPPTLLIHQYYYTGDRSFQAQLLRGGPSILVVDHPRTGERLYLDAAILPGAPRVTYTANTIDYDYGERGIRVEFWPLGHEHVRYRTGKPVTRQIREQVLASGQATQSWVERTGIPEDFRNFGRASNRALIGLADRVNTTRQVVTTPMVRIAQSLPGAQWLVPTREQLAERRRDLEVTQAQEAARRLEGTIRTNR